MSPSEEPQSKRQKVALQDPAPSDVVGALSGSEPKEVDEAPNSVPVAAKEKQEALLAPVISELQTTRAQTETKPKKICLLHKPARTIQMEIRSSTSRQIHWLCLLMLSPRTPHRLWLRLFLRLNQMQMERILELCRQMASRLGLDSLLLW